MTVQRFLLRLVFGSLALAACFGAAAVIFAGHENLWRVVGTCFATAVGSLLLFWSSGLLDREDTRRSGVLATALVLTEYLLILGLTWDLFGGAADEVGLTATFLAATGIPAIAFLVLQRKPQAAAAARLGIAVCALDLAILMIGVWGTTWAHVRIDDNRWFAVGGSLAAFGFLGVISLIGAGRDRRHWRWVGVAAAAVGFAISAYAILLDLDRSSPLLVCITSVAVVVAHANAMMQCPLKPGQRWLLGGTVGAAIATGVFVDLGQLTKPWHEELLGRLAGAGAIVAGCGTLALLVLARLNRDLPRPGISASEVREITLVCPRCGKRQTIAAGDGRCAECGLGIEVRLQETPTE